MTKAVFFDVANTLLHKPRFFPILTNVLENNGIEVPMSVLMEKHQLISEIILFPDVTSEEFYREFNRYYLMAIGVNPDPSLLDQIFNQCKYLPWEKFSDLEVLEEIDLPIGIISNWNSGLVSKLTENFPKICFDWILGSEDKRLRKPSIEFYQMMIDESGFLPSEILYVGDSIKLDILPSQQLGINSVLIDRENTYPYSNLKRINSMRSIISMV